MPYKKRQHARFPPARIKKIMQMDDDVGKVSSPVPVMVSRALERFLEYLITSSAERATSKDVKTLTPQHFLEVISNDPRLSFLRDLTLKSCNANGSSSAGGTSNGSTNHLERSKSTSSNSSKSVKKSDENDIDEDEEDDDEDDDY